MDFYWHYASKETIDPAGQETLTRALNVASQVFNTITEVIQVRIFVLEEEAEVINLQTKR